MLVPDTVEELPQMTDLSQTPQSFCYVDLIGEFNLELTHRNPCHTGIAKESGISHLFSLKTLRCVCFACRSGSRSLLEFEAIRGEV